MYEKTVGKVIENVAAKYWAIFSVVRRVPQPLRTYPSDTSPENVYVGSLGGKENSYRRHKRDACASGCSCLPLLYSGTRSQRSIPAHNSCARLTNFICLRYLGTLAPVGGLRQWVITPPDFFHQNQIE